MKRGIIRSISTALSLFVFLCPSIPSASPIFEKTKIDLLKISNPEPVQRANELISEARKWGIQYLKSDKKDDKNETKDLLKEAEKILKYAIDKYHPCQSCVEKLAECYFYKTYFKLDKDYEDCLKITEQGLEKFPESSQLAFFRGYAQYNSENYAEASKSLNYFLILSAGHPEAEIQVKELLTDAQNRFLNGWHDQADFYNSKEAHIYTYNQQTYQFQTVFQVSPNWELKTGNQALTALTSQGNTLNDPEIQTYLEDLTNRLLINTPGPYSSYKVTILDNPEINAVTPPGHIIVYTGLLAFVDTEAQLAGVLSHELAHNFGHHSARRYIKAYHTNNLTNSIYKSIDPQNDWAALGAQIGTQIMNDLFIKAHSRDHEKEADLYGAHIMFNAGYSPTALAEFFLKLYKYNPKSPPKFLSTHPPNPDRINYLTDYIESFPMDREMKVSSEAFDRIKSRFTPMEMDNVSENGALPPIIKNK
jgi:hypothetical protein